MRKSVSFIMAVLMLIAGVFAPASAYAKTTLKADASSFVFTVGGSKKMRVFKNGKLLSSGQMKYSSSNKKIAKVDASGNIKALKAGKATVTATLKSNKKLKVKYKLTVKKKSASFTVTPSSVPLNGFALNFSTYNKNTKHYYLLRSYMEFFEKNGGGKLTLEKGTYSFPTAVAIPSNVTLVFRDGVTVKKTAKTGSRGIGNSGSLFLLVEPSRQKVKKAHKKYNGVHDVTVKSTGKAVIDMKGTPSDKDALSFVLCHNQNIRIENLTFKNVSKGHFIELDASKNVDVINCKFYHQLQEKADSLDECINIDTPDKNTNGFRHDWTAYDKTPNKNVTVSGCLFSKVQRGIGAHSYSEGKYHDRITIENCTFRDCWYGAVGMVNFTNAQMTGNTVCGVGKTSGGKDWNTKYYGVTRGVIISGCSGVTMKDNTFKYVFEPIRFTPKRMTAYKGYADTFNEVLSDEAYTALAQQNFVYADTVERPFIRVFTSLDSSGSGADRQGDYYLSVK